MSPKPFCFHDNRPDKGISWTDGPGTKFFTYEAAFPGMLAMKGTIRAHDRWEAKRFIKARWPDSHHLVQITGAIK